MELDTDTEQMMHQQQGHMGVTTMRRDPAYMGLNDSELAAIVAALGPNDPAVAQLVAAARRMQLAEDGAAAAQNGGSILEEERGRGHILEQAQADGSSFVCERCHGLVAARRREHHLALWCPALP